ncbi:hypothetical protein ES288_1Z038200v1 [Gossypium darwinii]|uniref:NB-ARC domain-containing protein n=1 Tax=Gossypium darwinii TaxID=34276 RepID=A0A5C7IZ56_GOSDA|nr:hypothetical protein ES288_1Z038200v1 [Gossypium darwinii]
MTLPPSLTFISIENFENLEFMCSKGFQYLTSLQKLRIYQCPKLTSLPEKDMLLSLEYLCIQRCPLVQEGCSRGKGREWFKIAHIPYVRIDMQVISPRALNLIEVAKSGIDFSTLKPQALKAKLAKNRGDLQLVCFSLFDLVKSDEWRDTVHVTTWH